MEVAHGRLTDTFVVEIGCVQWKKEEVGLKQDYEEKLERLRDEKNNISEEFTKIRHKAKVRIKMDPTTHHVRIVYLY